MSKEEGRCLAHPIDPTHPLDASPLRTPLSRLFFFSRAPARRGPRRIRAARAYGDQVFQRRADGVERVQRPSGGNGGYQLGTGLCA